MVYRDLLNKKMVVCGSQKIICDLKDFFCELFIKTEYVMNTFEEKVFSAILEECDENTCILLGWEKEEFIEKRDNKVFLINKKSILFLDDLYNMIDELETFYIDKLKRDKNIVLYGSEGSVSKLIKMNPHLRVNYSAVETSELSNVELVYLEQIPKIDNCFCIIADPVSKDTKDRFLNMGLEFGKQFHFFNMRAPVHYTSYYLKKTMFDKPRYILPCDYTKRALSIKAHGNVMACCSSISLVFGNCLYTSIEEILNGIQAQLVNLSIRNRTYSFCGNLCFMYREQKYSLDGAEEIEKNFRIQNEIHKVPDFNVQLGYDRSCNLACPSCRNHRITQPEDTEDVVEMIHEEVIRMCHLRPGNIRIGNGELFFSKYYKDIIYNHYEAESIALITNGMLFTPQNWSHLEKRYKNVSLEVSIDATKPETYRKLRGGNLEILKNNMEYAGLLRQKGKLKKLSISFVIQADNYEQMKAFVEYGKSIHADFIHFMKINSWGHIPSDIFASMDVYDPYNIHHKHFVEILQDPIFREPFVHVDNLSNFVNID